MLHCALMDAIHRGGKGAQLQVIPHIMTLIQELRVIRDRISAPNNAGVVTSTTVERGVDKLLQLIQMLIAAECLDRNEVRKFRTINKFS